MSEPQAGWYPDPSGDKSKLRYWDGTQWTNDFTANPHYDPQQAQAEAQQAQAAQQPQGVPTPQAQSYADQQYQQTIPVQTQYQVSSKDETLRLIAFILYAVSLAYVVVIGLASLGIGLIALAWTIPMTVMCWRIYKGQRANTVAFGVCTILFIAMPMGIAAGILLLCSTKEK